MNPPPGLGDDDDAIGLPPGIDIPQKKKIQLTKKSNQAYPQPSLESLNLELKVTVQDQQFDQIPLNSDYLEPSVNNLIPYNGFLCDTSGSDSLGIWDGKMKLIKECKGLVENMPNKMVSIHDKLFAYNDCFESLFLIEPAENRKTIIIEMPLQAFCVSDHTNPRLIGVSDGTFHLWKLPSWGKPNQKEPIFNNIPSLTNQIELQRTMSEKYEEFDDLLILQNGVTFTKQKKVGEVFLVDFDANLVEELPTTYGCAVTCWTAISYDLVAFASNNGQIVVARFIEPKVSEIYVVFNQTKEKDIHHGLCFANGLLFSISKNAVLQSWNIQSKTKMKHTEVKFCPGVYSLQTMNQETIIAEHKEKKDFILFNTNLEKQFTYKARVKRVLHCCASPNDQFVAIVQQSGVLYDEEVVFHCEIEIFPFDSKLEFPRRRDIDNLEVKTVQFFNDSTLQFILKIVKSVNPILVKWNFITNEYVETEMLVEKYKSCQLLQTRSVFSYDFHIPLSQQFNLFAPKRIDGGSLNTGISVYDENIKRLLKVTFQQQFNADVFGMPTQNLLYVLNSKNQIEVWDVTTQQQVQKGTILNYVADCRPNIIKSIKFSPQYLFLNAQQEWIIRDLKLSQICKTKGGLVNKCLFTDQKCIIHQNVTLYEWDLGTNTCTRIALSFPVNDFCIVWGKVLAIGDSNIKML